MLLRCIYTERQKLRHSIIFPACIFIPIIPAIMGTFNYQQNTEILTSTWYSLWTQHTLFYASFFYAPLIALYCSYLWRLEHINNNWNVLMTSPVSIPCLYLGKLFVIFGITLITQLWVGFLYMISGKLIGLAGFPPAQFSCGFCAEHCCRGNRIASAFALYENKKLLRPNRHSADWKCNGTAPIKPGIRAVLSVFSDAHGNERKQNTGCSFRRIIAVFLIDSYIFRYILYCGSRAS